MNDLAAHIDFETASATDLKAAGVYRYAEDPTTRIWGFSWRIGTTGPVRQWRPGYADPVDLLEHVEYGGKVVAHGAAFERTIWNRVLRPRYVPHWPILTISQQDCTMARAASIAHPQDLDTLCNVLETKNRKDREGHAIMMKMAKPRSYLPDGTIVWWDDPDLWDRNMQYCDGDVYTETDVDQMIPQLTPTWRRAWELDQRINERGVYLDMNAVNKCVDLVEYAKKQADRTMRETTREAGGPVVPKCSNVAGIIEFLNVRGIETDTLRKGDQDDLIFMADAHQDTASATVIELRKFAAKTSTAKYKAMQKSVSADSRSRGVLNFSAAGTGRWGGRIWQPQNLVRLDPDDTLLAAKIAWLHELLRRHDLNPKDVYDHIEAVHGPLEPLALLSVALRSMIKAAPGNKLVGGDFSNIEGRVNAWLAGETWKLEAFKAYDNKMGEDLYKLAYARSFGVPVETVGKGQKRQIGKVQELACGFQGGVGAYITMGDTYRVNVYELTEPVRQAATQQQWEATIRQYETPGTIKHGLKAPQWVALKICVDNWRAANPMVVQSWWDYQDAAISAVSTPGTVFHCAGQRVGYYSDTRALWCILPSGRMLCYSSPWIETTKQIVEGSNGPYERIKNTVWFMGKHPLTKQWTELSLYGGRQCENIVQATACDIMVDRMFALEEAGFPIILTVHDEILAELDERSNLGAPEFTRVMSNVSDTYAGLPVAVSAWEDERYVK